MQVHATTETHVNAFRIDRNTRIMKLTQIEK